MNDNDFYNSENDGYRYSYGGYTDPIPTSGGPVGPEAPVKKKKKGGVRKVIAMVLVCVLAGGCAGVGGAALYGYLNPPAAPQLPAGDGSGTTAIQEDGGRPQVQTVVNANSGQAMTPAQLYAANLPSCVGITVSTTVNIYGRTTTSAASGSGFVLTQDGYIATNYHVIEEAAENDSVDIQVSFADDSKYTAKLVGGEKDNDIAVIKIDASGLTPVTLGDSDRLVVGEPVYAIGNPLGELTFTFTDGMVSALDRLISTSSTNQNGQTETTTLNVLQTNCAINPGNSGGPLFDSYGNVVGITTAKYTQSSSGVSAEGLGFAIPIDDVKDMFTDIIQNGYVTGKPYLGIQVKNVTQEVQSFGIPAGAVVQYVAEDSCAEKAGLQVNDIIIAIDGTAVDSSDALTAALSSNYKAGDTAVLTVIRQQQQVKLTVTLDEKNEQTEANNQLGQQQQQQQQQQQTPDSGWGSYYQWPFGSFFW